MPLHQIVAGDALGDRVLHLQTGVHLQEVVVQLVVHNELYCARPPIADGQGRSHGVFAHSFAHGWGDHRGRRFFNDFLATALRGAIALT